MHSYMFTIIIYNAVKVTMLCYITLPVLRDSTRVVPLPQSISVLAATIPSIGVVSQLSCKVLIPVRYQWLF